MFKVMSLNCNYLSDKHGPWDKRLSLITDLIDRTSPDVILFQAVTLDPGKTIDIDQGSLIAEHVNYKYSVFQPADCTPERTVLGQTIISKYPVTGIQTLGLSTMPGVEDQSKRLLMKGDILLREGILYIYNAHFSWITAQTKQNIGQSMPFIESNTPHSGLGLLMGDFNAPSDIPIFDPLINKGWEDAWVNLKKDEPGPTFESSHPDDRIDYAWVNKNLKKYLQDIEVFNNESSDGSVRMSDHLALMLTLTLHAE